MTIEELQDINLEKLQNETILKQIGKSLEEADNYLIQKTAEIYFSNNKQRANKKCRKNQQS